MLLFFCVLRKKVLHFARKATLAVLEQVTYEQRGEECRAVDTSILDMYAVVRDTGEVIASGKTDWGDIGSKAYQAATGE